MRGEVARRHSLKVPVIEHGSIGIERRVFGWYNTTRSGCYVVG